MLILVANEPRSYREAFAAAFRGLRPSVEAIAVDPEILDREVSSLLPDLVICSHVTPTIEVMARSWLELRVEDETLVAASNLPALPAGRDLNLADLLAFIDESEKAIQPGLPRGG